MTVGVAGPPEPAGVLSAWKHIRAANGKRPHQCALPPYWAGLDGKPYICPCGREYLLVAAPDVALGAMAWEVQNA